MISLAAGPKHGHAIMLDIAEFAGMRLGPGTLYGAISRLEADGLLESLAADGRRRPYRLTDAGRAELQIRLDAIDPVLAAGRARVATR